MHLKITDIFYGQHNNVKHPEDARLELLRFAEDLTPRTN